MNDEEKRKSTEVIMQELNDRLIRTALALEWALGLIDLYDECLIQLGYPPEKVEVHQGAKKRALEVIEGKRKSVVIEIFADVRWEGRELDNGTWFAESEDINLCASAPTRDALAKAVDEVNQLFFEDLVGTIPDLPLSKQNWPTKVYVPRKLTFGDEQ